MINIRFRFLSVAIFAVIGVFLFANYASAYTWERTPSGYFEGQAVTYIVDDFNYAIDCIGAPLDGYWWIDVYSQDGNSDFIHELNSEPSETFREHEFLITEYEYPDNDYIQAGIVCSDADFNQVSFLEFEINEMPPYLFRLEQIEQNNNQNNGIWNSDNGFWGSTTALEIGGTLQAGVQNTGADLWPLLIFLGVSLAFIIFLQVVFLTKKSVKPSNKKDFDPAAFNKKADELEEFFSKTGGASDEIVETITKRKRGRPRKNPVID